MCRALAAAVAVLQLLLLLLLALLLPVPQLLPRSLLLLHYCAQEPLQQWLLHECSVWLRAEGLHGRAWLRAQSVASNKRCVHAVLQWVSVIVRELLRHIHHLCTVVTAMLMLCMSALITCAFVIQSSQLCTTADSLSMRANFTVQVASHEHRVA
jgi:hypothetical protein